ncbi:MAG TPA: SAM-dependent methyltransferase [Peptococcaceae bacterium]|nr:MAG: Uncharacterized protein XD50_1132 [Clostridia bacterium 41_269]HBT20733.1 SAM-dependent methyltransferase [Peptococcaceae bacterium]
MSILREGEKLEDLQRNNLKIIQKKDAYRFSTDAVLLAHFVKLSKEDAMVVDLGTGSGILPILLSALYPRAAFVGIEIQEELADMAKRSVELNGLENSVQIIHGDLRRITDYLKPNCADTVVTNPPYIPKDGGLVSPNRSIALAKQEILCSLEDIFYAANRILKGRGSMFMIHRPQRLGDLCCLGRKYDLEPKGMRFVHPKAGREAHMVLIEFVKNSLPGMKVFPPLVVLKENGKYTQEVEEMYYGEKGQ